MAARTEDRKFGSFALTDTNAIAIQSWRMETKRRTRFRPKQAGDGSILAGSQLEGFTVRLSGLVTGTDTEDLTDNFDALQEALHSGYDWLRLYNDRQLLCRLDGGISHEFVAGSGAGVIQWAARLRSERPYWEATSNTTESLNNQTGAGPFSWTFSAAVGGDAVTYPIFTITAQVGFTDKWLTIVNDADLRPFQLLGLSLNAGQSIVVDMEKQRIGDGLDTAITPQSVAGRFFPLAGATTPSLTIEHSVGASADFDFSCTYRARHWTA